MNRGRHILDARLAAQELGGILETGALVPLVVTGASMAPFLRHQKDVVYLRSPSVLVPKKGDIVLFERETGELILHRIFALTDEGNFIINGDAQTWFEGIAAAQVLGTVEKISRNDAKLFSPRRLDWRLLSIIWRRLLPIRPRIFKLIAWLKGKSYGH